MDSLPFNSGQPKFYPDAKIEHDNYGDRINLKGTRESWTVSRCQTDMAGEKIGVVVVYSSTTYTPLFTTTK